MSDTTQTVDTSNYHEWTTCQVHGHNFVKDEESGRTHCTDCGEESSE